MTFLPQGLRVAFAIHRIQKLLRSRVASWIPISTAQFQCHFEDRGRTVEGILEHRYLFLKAR